MTVRLGGFQGDLKNAQRGIIRGAAGPLTRPKTLAAGMGTKNFIGQIVDIFAGLDGDRKQELINFATQLGEAQRAEKSLLAL